MNSRIFKKKKKNSFFKKFIEKTYCGNKLGFYPFKPKIRSLKNINK